MLSIHQTALLQALSENHEVTLVIQTLFEQERHNSGWNIPQTENIHVEVAPTDRRINELLQTSPEAIHIFSGIDAYPMVFRAFRQCIRYKRTILIYAEPYQGDGLFGQLRRLKYFLLHLKYEQYIHALLTTGQFGVQAYLKAGWQKSKIFEWGYFTTQHTSDYHDLQSLPKKLPNILFVGRLDYNKRILQLVRQLKMLRSQISVFSIVGTGPLTEEVQALIKDTENFLYLGKLTNANVQKTMQKHDLLVLPSQYDGWGAVVNEALQQGMRVLCSDHCGASSLLDGIKRGGIFSWSKRNGFEKALIYWINKGSLTQEERMDITEWSKTAISGFAASQYMINIVHFIQGATSTRPIPPWSMKGEQSC